MDERDKLERQEQQKRESERKRLDGIARRREKALQSKQAKMASADG
jgi:hypothetical protein